MNSHLLVLKPFSQEVWEQTKVFPLGIFPKRKEAKSRLDDIQESDSWRVPYHAELEIIEVPVRPSLDGLEHQHQAMKEMENWC